MLDLSRCPKELPECCHRLFLREERGDVVELEAREIFGGGRVGEKLEDAFRKRLGRVGRRDLLRQSREAFQTDGGRDNRNALLERLDNLPLHAGAIAERDNGKSARPIEQIKLVIGNLSMRNKRRGGHGLDIVRHLRAYDMEHDIAPFCEDKGHDVICHPMHGIKVGSMAEAANAEKSCASLHEEGWRQLVEEFVDEHGNGGNVRLRDEPFHGFRFHRGEVGDDVHLLENFTFHGLPLLGLLQKGFVSCEIVLTLEAKMMKIMPVVDDPSACRSAKFVNVREGNVWALHIGDM